MRIAYPTLFDALDVNQAWSGIGYFLPRALADVGCEIQYIGPLETQPTRLAYRKKWLAEKIEGKRYSFVWDPDVMRNYARQVSQELESSNADVVLSVGVIPVAYLESELPLAIWADATFYLMRDYYPEFKALPYLNLRAGMKAEKLAQRKVVASIFSSDWAAESAQRDFGVSHDCIHVVPFGANMATAPDRESVKQSVQKRDLNKCSLLAVGVSWERKGFDVALDVTKALNDSGHRTHLTIIGCELPPSACQSDYVTSLGRLDKSRASDLEKLHQAFCDATFFILPTIADCTPIVLNEANSFGLPCLTTRTGGISTIIRSGVNGFLFESGDVDEYVGTIIRLLEDRIAYIALAESSLEEYHSRLNWRRSAESVRQILEKVTT